jgi:hypothetical protein
MTPLLHSNLRLSLLLKNKIDGRVPQIDHVFLLQEFEETTDVESSLMENNNKVAIINNKIKEEEEVKIKST